MDGFSTITQKGQVSIPKGIRDYFGLKTSDKIYFSVKGDTIIAKPIQRIENMRGFIKTNKVLTKKQMKKTVQDAVLEKYAHRS